MLTDAVSQLFHFCDQFFSGHLFQISVHGISCLQKIRQP
jgi:hypothetical protein